MPALTVYSNTMMTSLNSRVGTQQTLSRGTSDLTSGVSATGTHNFTTNHNFRSATTSVRTNNPGAPVVHIASHTEVYGDDQYSDKNVRNSFVRNLRRSDVDETAVTIAGAR